MRIDGWDEDVGRWTVVFSAVCAERAGKREERARGQAGYRFYLYSCPVGPVLECYGLVCRDSGIEAGGHATPTALSTSAPTHQRTAFQATTEQRQEKKKRLLRTAVTWTEWQTTAVVLAPAPLLTASRSCSSAVAGVGRHGVSFAVVGCRD